MQKGSITEASAGNRCSNKSKLQGVDARNLQQPYMQICRLPKKNTGTFKEHLIPSPNQAGTFWSKKGSLDLWFHFMPTGELYKSRKQLIASAESGVQKRWTCRDSQRRMTKSGQKFMMYVMMIYTVDHENIMDDMMIQSTIMQVCKDFLRKGKVHCSKILHRANFSFLPSPESTFFLSLWCLL